MSSAQSFFGKKAVQIPRIFGRALLRRGLMPPPPSGTEKTPKWTNRPSPSRSKRAMRSRCVIGSPDLSAGSVIAERLFQGVLRREDRGDQDEALDRLQREGEFPDRSGIAVIKRRCTAADRSSRTQPTRHQSLPLCICANRHVSLFFMERVVR